MGIVSIREKSAYTLVQRSAGTYKVRYMPDGRILLDPKGPLLMTFSTPINTMEDLLILPTSQPAQDFLSDELSSQALSSLKNSEISSKSFASSAQQSNPRPSLLKPWSSKARLPKSLLPPAPSCQSVARSNSPKTVTGPSILPPKLVTMSSALNAAKLKVDVSCTPPMKYREFREFIKQEKYKGTSTTHLLTEAI